MAFDDIILIREED